ncbi:MAG: hypothetical protein CK431_04330 [Mycobacterium sp.]|nr:MAG: hypothetical protein CK431_04330 [Mycobacterium sp.]
MSNIDNIYAAEPAAAGSIFVAPLGTEGPSMPTPFDELDPAFIDLGEVGEDGFNEVSNRKNDKKRNFGGRVVKVLQTEYDNMVELVFLESLNAEVLKAVYGSANVTVVAATEEHGTIVEVRKNARRLPHLSWVVDTLDTTLGDGEYTAKYRSYIPDGQIFEIGDVKVVHTDTIEYKVTIQCFEDESGQHIYTWSDDGRPVAGS